MIRHSRAAAFHDALDTTRSDGANRRWTDDAPDPNAPAALVRRADVLRRAWRPAIPDRVKFLVDRCAGNRVMDIGCVAHDIERMQSPQWLHRRLAESARECIGVDIHESGVQEMQRLGFTAVVHDLGEGLGPFAAQARFDVIVAGELIEHVESIDMLFGTAAEALDDGGELIITTPNPWAPHRVRAGQLGYVWENTDHIVFAFPSGIAELAERHGLILVEATTTDEARRVPTGRDLVKAVRGRLRGRQWANVGIATVGDRKVTRIGFTRLGQVPHGLWWPRRRFIGETFVYVLRRRQTSPDGSPS